MKSIKLLIEVGVIICIILSNGCDSDLDGVFTIEFEEDINNEIVSFYDCTDWESFQLSTREFRTSVETVYDELHIDENSTLALANNKLDYRRIFGEDGGFVFWSELLSFVYDEKEYSYVCSSGGLLVLDLERRFSYLDRVSYNSVASLHGEIFALVSKNDTNYTDKVVYNFKEDRLVEQMLYDTILYGKPTSLHSNVYGGKCWITTDKNRLVEINNNLSSYDIYELDTSEVLRLMTPVRSNEVFFGERFILRLDTVMRSSVSFSLFNDGIVRNYNIEIGFNTSDSELLITKLIDDSKFIMSLENSSSHYLISFTINNSFELDQIINLPKFENDEIRDVEFEGNDVYVLLRNRIVKAIDCDS